jgi:hypothetical protein
VYYQPVDIFIEGIRIGGAEWDSAVGSLSKTVSRGSTSTVPVISPRTCSHAITKDGYAYMDAMGQHWPVQVCIDCRSILRGLTWKIPSRRDPNVPEWERYADAATVAEAILEDRWYDEWPKPGRPRRKTMPKGFVWPESA